MKVFQLSLLWKWQEPLPPPLPPKYTFFLRALSSEGTDGLKIVDFGQDYQKSSVIFSASIFRGECWPLTGNHIPASLQSWAPKSCSVISKLTGHQHQGWDGAASLGLALLSQHRRSSQCCCAQGWPTEPLTHHECTQCHLNFLSTLPCQLAESNLSPANETPKIRNQRVSPGHFLSLPDFCCWHLH